MKSKSSDDPARARLLFCETLLEEYKSLAQPALDENKVTGIETRIKNYRNTPADARTQTEKEFSGEVLKEIYSLMYDAQQQTAEALRADCEKASENVADAAEKTKIVDAALIREVLGDGEVVLRPKESENGSDGHEPRMTAREAQKLAGSTLRSALCLSGGGVRSATFNLGILQGLARHGLLDKFDYLSTVSGGGFVGGWLSAWIRRAGLYNVVNALKREPESPLVPDPPEVEYLRIYSNYLSPRPGLLSADTWTLISTVFRNLILNWLVFVPVFVAMLLLPRVWTSIVLRSTHQSSDAIWISLFVGFVAGALGLSYIGRSLPSANDYTRQQPAKEDRCKTTESPFLTRCLIWLIVSAAALAVCLWGCYQPQREPFFWLYYSLFIALVSAIAWLCSLWKIHRLTPVNKRGPRYLTMLLVATVIIIVAVPLIVGFIASSVILLALPTFHQHHVVYAVFAVPLILLLMGLIGLLITGFTSRFAKDQDQEWWARAGAWIFIVVIGWGVVHLLVLYGPLLLLKLETTYHILVYGGGLRNLTWADWGKMFVTVSGIASGVITLFGGFSAKTPANAKEAQKSGGGGILLSLATQLLAPIFLGFLIILISLGTDWILVSRPSQALSQLVAGVSLPDATRPYSEWHRTLLNETPFLLALTLTGAIALLGAGLGRLINTNMFSLQYLWRNRIIRAYLGASHRNRRPDPFTGFDSYDNLQMHELWPKPGEDTKCEKREDRPEGDLDEVRDSKKLFHVLNMALNLSGGEKLQWQDRKAESFTVSPLHAGSYWLGYRRSRHYGGPDGISLGGSVAISGAFVSPNMGYMMTSPVVRFLMAIFNVRFGWWLGNPGPAGDDTFELESPRLSVRPFLSEAFGRTDDQSPYVYLSDGGHFENLGLYEMVLRRCRFIVVSDASTDPDYSFESLATSIRQIRVDLGVPIDIRDLAVGVPSQNLKNKYCAIGRIRYSCVDRDPNDSTKSDDDYDGILVFIKPSLIGQEPRDVINYWQGRSSFPQEVITDQWFSEAQFESYRALGSFIIDAICQHERREITLAGFAQKVDEHNQLKFQAFRDQISYLALEHKFIDELKDAPASYRAKVRQFMDSLLR
jgi:patatin-like phospholipase